VHQYRRADPAKEREESEEQREKRYLDVFTDGGGMLVIQ